MNKLMITHSRSSLLSVPEIGDDDPGTSNRYCF